MSTPDFPSRRSTRARLLAATAGERSVEDAGNAQEAYDVLSDPRERARYDRVGHDKYLDGAHGASSDGRTTGRGHGTARDSDGESTEEHEQRRRDETTDASGDHERQSTTGPDWRAHTRGRAAVGHVWNDRARDATTPPDPETEDVSASRRVVAYALVVLPLAALSPVFSAWWFRVAGVGSGTADVNSVGAAVLTALLATGCFFGTVVLAERLLETDRRLLSWLDRSSYGSGRGEGT